MSSDWYPGIRVFCSYWSQAQTLQSTFATFDQEFIGGRDSCIDAAKALIECSCRVLVDQLEDPATSNPLPDDASLSDLLSRTVKLLKIQDQRDTNFVAIIREHNRTGDALRKLRNIAGTVSHGKGGFVDVLTAHHRRAAALAADSIISFLHNSYLGLEPDPLLSNERYEKFSSSNQVIDNKTTLEVDVDDDGVLQVVVVLPNGEEIPLSIPTSLLLFGSDRQAYVDALAVCE